jgi:hypothetical protein
MAREAGRDTPTAWTRMPSGKTLSQEIRDRGGVVGRARQAQSRFSRRKAGEVPFTLEDMLPAEDVTILKFGDPKNNTTLLDQHTTGKSVNPFAALPYNPSKDQLRDIVTLYDDGGDYYQPEVGESYRNKAATPVGPGTEQYLGLTQGYTSAAPLSEVPTSTTDPSRPRTVAAGYEIGQGKQKGKITVVFRDGTYYNYYDVTPTEWGFFRQNRSKGLYIRLFLDKKPRGVANASNIDPNIRQQLYRVLETAQKYTGGKLSSARTRRQVTKAASNIHANPTARNPTQRRR